MMKIKIGFLLSALVLVKPLYSMEKELERVEEPEFMEERSLLLQMMPIELMVTILSQVLSVENFSKESVIVHRDLMIFLKKFLTLRLINKEVKEILEDTPHLLAPHQLFMKLKNKDEYGTLRSPLFNMLLRQPKSTYFEKLLTLDFAFKDISKGRLIPILEHVLNIPDRKNTELIQKLIDHGLFAERSNPKFLEAILKQDENISEDFPLSELSSEELRDGSFLAAAIGNYEIFKQVFACYSEFYPAHLKACKEDILYTATRAGSLKILKYLWLLGNVDDSFMPFVLLEALNWGQVEIIKFLKKRNIQLPKLDSWHSTFLSTLYRHLVKGQKEHARALLDEAGDQRDLVLKSAVGADNSAWVAGLFELGIRADCEQETKSPLMIAINRNNVEIVELLLNNNAQVNRQDFVCQDTALHRVCLTNNLCVLNSLLKKGADPLMPNIIGTTPFGLACRFGRMKMVKILLENITVLPCKELNEEERVQFIQACKEDAEKVSSALLTKALKLPRALCPKIEQKIRKAVKSGKIQII